MGVTGLGIGILRLCPCRAEEIDMDLSGVTLPEPVDILPLCIRLLAWVSGTSYDEEEGKGNTFSATIESPSGYINI